MDLRLALRLTRKLVVASPKGDLVFLLPFPALPCRALDSSVPSGTGLRKIFMVGRTGPLLEAYTKGPPCRSGRWGGLKGQTK